MNLIGAELAEIIEQRLRSYGLDLSKLRGMGFDGGANMSGYLKGVQARLAQIYETAIFVHCFAHRLNLIVKKSVNNDLAKRLYDEINDIANFFNFAKRRKILTGYLAKNPIPKPISTTRWTDTYTTANAVLRAFREITEALEHIANADSGFDVNTQTRARGIRSNMRTHTFVFGLYVRVDCIFDK